MKSGAAAGAAAAGGGAAAVLIADAIKASGVVVRVEAGEFLKILARIHAPLVVHAPPGTFTIAQRYMTSHKGLAFFSAPYHDLLHILFDLSTPHFTPTAPHRLPFGPGGDTMQA